MINTWRELCVDKKYAIFFLLEVYIISTMYTGQVKKNNSKNSCHAVLLALRSFLVLLVYFAYLYSHPLIVCLIMLLKGQFYFFYLLVLRERNAIFGTQLHFGRSILHRVLKKWLN